MKVSRQKCRAETERFYIQSVLRLPEAAASNFTLASFEATPKYAKLEYSDVSERGYCVARQCLRSGRACGSSSSSNRSSCGA